jgi:hypothetical protein
MSSTCASTAQDRQKQSEREKAGAKYKKIEKYYENNHCFTKIREFYRICRKKTNIRGKVRISVRNLCAARNRKLVPTSASTVQISVADPDPNPDPDPPDPHVFGPPGSGSGSISQRYGSGSGSGSGTGSFYHWLKYLGSRR